MKTHSEVGLKFTVPAASRAGLRDDMAKGDATERSSMATLHLDTEARHLARSGLEWRLQREGRRWIQTLKSSNAVGLEWSEHEVIRSRPQFDAAEHAGTPIGERLLTVLSSARQEGAEVGVRSQTELRRVVRRVRTKGATVEVIVDEGRMLSDQATRPIRNIEFRLVSGSASAMLVLVERWRKRHGLLFDPRSDAERGEELAEGTGFPPIRKAGKPDYPRDASTEEAFGRVVEECVSHMTRNAVGLYEGDPALRVEHVHQLRVAIRRLRSALRSFKGWTPEPSPELIEPLRALFSTLGLARDADVLSSGVMAALQKSGAPAATAPVGDDGPDAADVVRSGDSQRLFLAWAGWRLTLSELPPRPADAQPALVDAPTPSLTNPPSDAQPGVAGPPGTEKGAPPLRHRAARRLHRWHERIVADWKAFDELDEPRLHALRKRIKRQRYAVEFFAPLLARRKLGRYVKSLASIQERMGELNDLFVAQARYQALVPADPTAWFALGWLTARIEVVRARAKPELARLAKTEPPR